MDSAFRRSLIAEHRVTFMLMMLGLKFAPLFLPLERRLQTLAVVYYLYEFAFSGLLQTILLFYLLFTKFYYLTLLYLCWFFYDRNTPYKGGRRLKWLRGGCLWTHFKNYFPVKLIKTTDLPADKNYIFGCHPHGVLSCSHFVNFATEGTHFSKIFPDLAPHLITVDMQFRMPIHRDILLNSGICAASSENIEYILSQKNTGNIVAIVVGGAREVIDCLPGTMILTLKKRKGFIRLALKYGASLVPVISFGENDLFITGNQLAFSRKIQEILLKFISFTIPLFFGRGIFQYSFGLLPFRKPINTVVGKPIHVEKNCNPTQEEIEKLQKRYIDDLVELFHQNKFKYGHENTILTIK